MNLLGPNGSPLVNLAGDRSWIPDRILHGVVCSFQWLHREDIDPEGPHPCMVIFSETRRTGVEPYVLPQRNAWAYVDNRGNPTAQLMGAAFKALASIGFDTNDKSAAFKVIDIIVEGVADLIRMPSDQARALEVKRRVYGMEATAKINGRVLTEQVL